MRVFVDTNVLVAAFATRGICADVLASILSDHELVLSQLILTELNRVLVNKLDIPTEDAADVAQFLITNAELVAPAAPNAWPRNDPDDRWVVAACWEGGVDVLVTGDQDLLNPPLELPFRVLSPRGFWELLARPA